MTKEILKRAIELDKSITKAKKWMEDIRKAEAICREEQYSGAFFIKIVTPSGNTVSIDIPPKVAIKACEDAHREILKEEERMSSKFKELH